MKFRLKEFREVKRLFQSDMAAILEVNQSSVSRMELRPFASLTIPQYNTLCERFGKEEVDKYVTDEDGVVVVSGNINEGHGNQTNLASYTDNSALDIIKLQTEALAELSRKQSEQADRLLAILEKLTGK